MSSGIRAGALAYLVWGLLTFYWKQLESFGAFELIGWRMLSAAVVMALVATFRARWPELRAAFRDRVVLAHLVLAALLLSVNWASYVWTVTNDRVLETALGYFMAPLGTMLVGVFVLRERPTRLQQIAMVCAAVAIVVLTVSYGRPPVAALLIAGAWTFYGLTKRRVPLDGPESLAGETLVMIVPAAIAVAVLAPGDASVPATASAADWMLVAGLGVVTALPLALFAVAARSVPFTILGPLQYLVPVINFLIGWVVYDEPLPPSRVVGFAFVWTALTLVTVDRIRAVRTPRPAVATSNT